MGNRRRPFKVRPIDDDVNLALVSRARYERSAGHHDLANALEHQIRQRRSRLQTGTEKRIKIRTAPQPAPVKVVSFLYPDDCSRRHLAGRWPPSIHGKARIPHNG